MTLHRIPSGSFLLFPSSYFFACLTRVLSQLIQDNACSEGYSADWTKLRDGGGMRYIALRVCHT